MSAARPPEGAHTVAKGEGTPVNAARPPEGARTAAAGEDSPVSSTPTSNAMPRPRWLFVAGSGALWLVFSPARAGPWSLGRTGARYVRQNTAYGPIAGPFCEESPLSTMDAVSREAVGAGFSMPAMLRARSLSLAAGERIARAVPPGMAQDQAPPPALQRLPPMGR